MMYIVLIILGIVGILLNRFGKDVSPNPPYQYTGEPYEFEDLGEYFKMRGIKFK